MIVVLGRGSPVSISPQKAVFRIGFESKRVLIDDFTGISWMVGGVLRCLGMGLLDEVIGFGGLGQLSMETCREPPVDVRSDAAFKGI